MTEVLPLAVGIRFAHASVQALADEHHLDVLHVKGPAVDESLLPVREVKIPETATVRTETIARSSLDADVLVRPSHVQSLITAMLHVGWTTKVRFEDGSPFEHAATMSHTLLPPVDVHRSFPGLGLDPETTFSRLWRERHEAPIGGYPCQVPSVTAQRLILLLNAARGGRTLGSEVRDLWQGGTPGQRRDVEQLAVQLKAQVALAAATGRLDDFATAREHDLWAGLSTRQRPGLAMWIARVRAAPDLRAALRTAVRLLLPNPRRLAMTLGRAPTARELLGAYGTQAARGARELRAAVRKAARGRPR